MKHSRIRTGLALWLMLIIAVLLAPLSLHLTFLDSFRQPALFMSIGMIVLALWRRQWLGFILMTVPVLALLTPWLASGSMPVSADMRQIKLIVLPSSDQEALDYALKAQPDLIFVPDFSDDTNEALGEQPVIHPAPAIEPRLSGVLPELSDHYRPWLLKTSDGMGIFIKAGLGEIDDIRVRVFGIDTRAFVVDAKLAGTEVTLAMVHLTRPFPLAEFGRQANQVEQLSAELANIPRPIILTGDFNALPWSKTLTQLSAAMAADHAQWVGTFPPGSPLKLSIDQVRVSGGLKIVALETGPFVGSIHLPLVATIAFPPR